MNRVVVSTLLIAAGIAAGFAVVTLTTEPYEQFSMGREATTYLKVATTALAAAALLYGAWRADGRGSTGLGLWLMVTGTATPVWFAFYEVDHAEAYVATAVAASLAWASLALRLPRPHRVAMVLVHVMAAVQFDGAFMGYFSFFEWHSAVALAATAAFVAATVAVEHRDGIRRAAPFAAVLLGLAVVPLAVFDIHDNGVAITVDYFIILVGAAAAIAAATLAGQAARRGMATPTP